MSVTRDPSARIETDIAIVGMSCRFPGADTVDQFWANVCAGVESISFWSREELMAEGIDPRLIDNPAYVRAGAVLSDVRSFDAQFFGVPPREAQFLDPQQRIFLECAWHALENAGYGSQHYQGSIGVYAGAEMSSYLLNNILSRPDLHAADDWFQIVHANDKDFLATRVSYKLNLRGPSITVQTGCSTSLVAVHLACQAILGGECDIALAGGVCVRVPHRAGYVYREGLIDSPDGHCRPFDFRAQGTVFGSGVGIVVLKSLAAALRDRDYVYAVIKGSAINNDGSAKVGYTAPSVDGQAAVIAESLDVAGVSAETISYVEAHGTGTALGDPIEVAGLTKAFRRSAMRRQYCALGAVKANVGHLASAAGVAGLIKAVLAVHHAVIPPTVGFEAPSPNIDFESSPFYVNTRLKPWTTNSFPRRAGVSSFGIGGTNAHVILEEAPSSQIDGRSRSWHLITASASSPIALRELSTSLAGHIEKSPGISAADVAFSLCAGRRAFQFRRIVVCGDVAEAGRALAQSEELSPAFAGRATEAEPRIVFMFPGQGAPLLGTGRSLYKREPVFRAALDRCRDVVQMELGIDLCDVLFPADKHVERARVELDRTVIAQPALFSIEYAFAELLRSWGIVPHAMIGHSLGEFVAASLAGVFSVEDALRIVTERGRLMESLLPGAMVAVRLSEQLAAELLDPQLAIAAVNSPIDCVIAGVPNAVANLEARLAERGLACRRLAIARGFHSAEMEPAAHAFLTVMKSVELREPGLPFISSLTGTWITATEAVDPNYWVRQMRGTVRFADGIRELLRQTGTRFVEVGPGQALCQFTKRCGSSGEDPLTVPTHFHAQSHEGDLACLLEAIGKLWISGVSIKWDALYDGVACRRVPLPGYPLERTPYWIDPVARSAFARPVAPADARDKGELVAEDEKRAPRLEADGIGPSAAVPSAPESSEFVISRVRSIVGELLGLDSVALDPERPFLSLGADSLLLIQAAQNLKREFGVNIPLDRLLDEFGTVSRLAAFLSKMGAGPISNMASDAAPFRMTGPPVPTRDQRLEVLQSHEHAPASDAKIASVERIVVEQLRVLSDVMLGQLEVLRGRAMQPDAGSRADPAIPAAMVEARHESLGAARVVSAPTGHATAGRGANVRAEPAVPADPALPFGRPNEPMPAHFDDVQREYLARFIAEYTRRTAGSRERAGRYRAALADPRVSTGFRMALKELVYPITVERGFGAQVWDVDGNEYVDLSMGFGVCIFGQAPRFITAAIQECLAAGIALGPQSDIAGDVAEMVCDLTGMDRAAFCNSGTEAVMTAVRLARTVTGRDRIAAFAGSYHGFYDGTLVRSVGPAGARRHVPSVPGVAACVADSVVILEYGAASALDELRDQARGLAAVLVEPVQSRRPDYQPVHFLTELRAITLQTETALIFDEIITGFRAHQGGVQALFGIRADLATYGKIVGGGLPIGVVAGAAKYMDACDGGPWRFGDESRPGALQTFFAGTFSKHPLAMVAAAATLRELKRGGHGLQEHLSATTAALATTLNAFFATEGVSFHVASFSSMFRFVFLTNELVGDLFRYHLIAKGVYVWEGGTCFLSTAHTDADIERVVAAVRGAVVDLRRGGFLLERGSPAAELGEPDPHDGVSPSDSYLGPTEPRSAVPVPSEARGAGGRAIPLVGPQKHLWLAVQLGEDASIAYNESLVLTLSGDLDVAALAAAVCDVVNHHEALRATFDPLGASLRIAERLEPDVSRVDFSELPEDARDSAVREWASSDVRRPFDLVNGPLLRASLGAVTGSEHVFVLTVHHLVCDATSMEIVQRDLAECYSSRTRGELPGPHSGGQLGEFVTWLQKRELSEDMEEDEDYWSTRFSDVPEGLALPTDRHRTHALKSSGAKQHAALDERLSKDVVTLGAARGCTPMMSLLAAFCLLLHRLTGQDDIVVGVPASLRYTDRHTDLVGYCLSLLPIRSRITRATTGALLLKAIRGAVGAGMEHRGFSLGHLTERLGGANAPSVSVIFNLDRKGGPRPAFGGLKTEILGAESGSAKFGLAVNVRDTGAGYEFTWEYNTELFAASTIRRWSSCYENLVRALVEQTDAPVDGLPLMASPDYQRIVDSWNATATQFDTNAPVHRLFESHARATPDLPAAVFSGCALTYGDLDAQSSRVARSLMEAGVGPEVRVAVCIERSLELLCAFLGVLRAGGVVVPLDPSMPPARLAFIVRDAQPHLILSDTRGSDLVPQDWQTIDIAKLCTDARPAEVGLPHDVVADNAAYLLYTSGSTGDPKGVIGTHGGLSNRLLWMQARFELDPNDRVLHKTPVTFDVALWELLWPLISGAAVIIAEPGAHRDYARLVDLIVEQRVTTLHFVPSLLATFLDEPNLRMCTSIRRIICSGEELQWDLKERCLGRLDADLHNLYGPTEASIDVTAWACSRGREESVVPIGRPISNTQIYVLDRTLRPMPPGVPGELYIGGIGLARGYLGRSDLTAERFLPNPFTMKPGGRIYRTGDRARFREDGIIEFLGRLDRQVKISGVRVEIGEVEAALARQSEIAEAAVLLRLDEKIGKRLVAYVSLRPGAILSVRELRRRLLDALPAAAVPSEFIEMERLPLTSSGKLDRRALATPDGGKDSASRHAPGTEIERVLAAIWAEVLGIEHVTDRDNFFELGGDSIQAIRVAARARELSIPITVGQLLRRATIAEIATELAGATASLPEEPDLPSRIALTPIQRWFFECAFEESHHFNQALLVELRAPLEAAHAARATSAVLRHHDVLRARFDTGTGTWSQAEPDVDQDGAVCFSLVDLTGCSSPEFATAVERMSDDIQRSLNLARGSLFRVCLFRGGANTGDRLLFVAHHLIVDTVSWQFIVRDFESAYEQLVRADEPRLPSKTTSFARWSGRLAEYATTAQNAVRVPTWLSFDASPTTLVGGEFTGEQPRDLAVTGDVNVGLTHAGTLSLVQAVRAVSDLALVDVLVASLLGSIFESFRGTALQIDFEGHGRTNRFADLDVSRTVGWFTTLYPVGFSLVGFEVSSGSLRSVGARLRDSREWAVDYGVLRYLTGGEEAERLKALPRPEILFNYLGDLDGTLAGSRLFRTAKEGFGAIRSERAHRSHALEVSAAVRHGRLEVAWAFDPGVLKRATVSALAEGFITILGQFEVVIKRASARATGNDAAPDGLYAFECAAPGESELCTRRVSLLPQQETMVLQTQRAPSSGVYCVQWACTLSGALDVRRVKACWEVLVRRHAALRVAIRHYRSGEPDQAAREGTSIKWVDQNWTSETADEQRTQLEHFLLDERTKGHRFDGSPLMRMSLIRFGRDLHTLVWCFHHAVLDGWSLQLVLDEFALLYAGAPTAEQAPVVPFDLQDYRTWLRGQDVVTARNFWRSHLSGFRPPERLFDSDSASNASEDVFAQAKIKLRTGTGHSLHKIARELRITPSTLVQAAWAIVLMKKCRSTDVLFGITTSGRSADVSGVDRAVGMFLNTVPARARTSLDTTLSAWLQELHDMQVEREHHSWVSLSNIDEWCDRSPGSPLFESAIRFQNFPKATRFNRLDSSVAVKETRMSDLWHYPVSLAVVPETDVMIYASYRADRLSASDARELLALFGSALEALLELGETPLALGEIQLDAMLRRLETAAIRLS